MPATEAIIYYLIIADCAFYNLLIYTHKKWHNKKHHWAFEKNFPLKPLFGLWYAILVIWLGFALNRLGLVFI